MADGDISRLQYSTHGLAHSGATAEALASLVADDSKPGLPSADHHGLLVFHGPTQNAADNKLYAEMGLVQYSVDDGWIAIHEVQQIAESSGGVPSGWAAFEVGVSTDGTTLELRRTAESGAVSGAQVYALCVAQAITRAPMATSATLLCWYGPLATVSGGNVTQWTDLSGNAEHGAPDTGDEPLWVANWRNNKPALYFDSANTEHIRVGNGLGIGGDDVSFSCACVFQCDDNAAMAMWGGGSSSEANSRIAWRATTATVEWRMDRRDSTATTQDKVEGTSDRYWHVAVTTYDGTTRALSVYLDGQAIIATTLTDLGTIDIDNWVIGGSFSNGADDKHFDGWIASWAMWDDALTSGEAASVSAFFGEWYGLTIDALPTHYGNCQGWWRFDSEFVALNGSDVSTAYDLTMHGYDFTQGTASKQPPYTASDLNFNGAASTTYASGDSHTLENSTAGLAAIFDGAEPEVTVFTACRFDAFNSTMFSAGHSTGTARFRCSTGGTPNWQTVHEDNAATVRSATGGTPATGTTYYSTHGSRTGSTPYLYVRANGSEQGTGNTATAAGTFNGCRFGSTLDAGTETNFFDGDLAEIAAFSADLRGSAQLTALEAYIAARIGA